MNDEKRGWLGAYVDGELGAQLAGLHEVVGIEERDELPAGHLQTHVAGTGGAAAVVDAAPAQGVAVARGQLGQHLGRGVGGAVVHHQHLHAGGALAQDGVQGLGQGGGGVPGRDDHAESDVGHGSSVRGTTS